MGKPNRCLSCKTAASETIGNRPLRIRTVGGVGGRREYPHASYPIPNLPFLPFRRADGATPAFLHLDRVEVHGESVDEEHPAAEGRADAGCDLEGFGRLKRAENAGDGREDADGRRLHVVGGIVLFEDALKARGLGV